MAFDSSQMTFMPGDLVFEDRFRRVELAVLFKRIVCHHCGFRAIYKFRAQQIRRKAEIETGAEEEVRADHVGIWESIPRFAEIPETVKCKRCREVIGLDTTCIY